MALALMAWAAACPAAAGAEPVALRLGGYSKWWLVGAWPSSRPPGYTPTDVKGDTEIHFTGSTRLDNGLTVGVKTELEAGGHTDQRTDPIDKAYAWAEGGWGRLEAGTDYNAASLLHVSAPDAAGLWNGPPNGVLSDTVIPRPGAVSTMYSGNQTGLDHDDNADKLLYFTPAWHGLSAAVSYTPSALSEDDRGVARRSAVRAVGLAYGGTVGGAGLAVSAGYLDGRLDAPDATGQETVQALSLGAQVSVAGMVFGGSFGHERHAYPARAASATAEDASGHAMDVGVMVEAGPGTLSLAHYRSSVRGLVADPARDRVAAWQLSGKYPLGAGIAVMGALAHIAYDDESGGDQNNEGVALMSGVGLWF